MFIDINDSVALTDEQFLADMVKRRMNMKGKNDWDFGCPLCQAPIVQAQAAAKMQEAMRTTK
jgi:hypothetical protein